MEAGGSNEATAVFQTEMNEHKSRDGTMKMVRNARIRSLF